MKVDRRSAGRPARLLEAGLWLVTAGCAVMTGVWTMQAQNASHRAAAIAPDGADESKHAGGQESVRSGDVIGRLGIVDLGFSVPIVEDYDSAALTRGVGHVPGTAVPGGLGNLVLAGHRDTYFRPLRRVRAGMEIEVTTRAGRWRYAIDRTEVVTPDRVDMLDVGVRPEMTLITCYPFSFIGEAPQRFIVHAHLLSVDASR